jgi:hypothetical protein
MATPNYHSLDNILCIFPASPVEEGITLSSEQLNSHPRLRVILVAVVLSLAGLGWS